MNQDLIEKISARSTGAALARLGASHGYRFEQDNVHLNAMFTILNPSAHERSWALQLWACPEAPSGRNDLAGHLVAEAALPPIGEVADEHEGFGISTLACPPAGQTPPVMVLVLASGTRGQFNEIHDLAVYSRSEQFAQPRLAGNLAFRVEGHRVTIEVEGIENPRAVENISGTLALEMWALKERYTGGGFRGEHLAGVSFGPLSGRHEFTFNSFDLPFTAPSAGTWHYVLMLREWTSAGFATRDYVNFALPVTIAAPATIAPPVKANAPVAATAPIIQAKPPVLPKAKAVEPEPKKSGKPAAAKGISLNTASAQEIRAVTGVPAKVAEGIVAKRPFKSLDELQNVKGVGAKLLAKIRSKLRL